MLTPRASRLRDWASFALAALVPTVAVGALGLRALRNEDAAIRRETTQALDATSERATRAVQEALTASATALTRLEVDADPRRAAAALGRTCPPFADAVLLGADRSVLVPLTATSSTAAPPRCAALADDIAGGGAAPATRRDFLSACAEARAPSGRWLWPVIAVASGDPTRRDQPHGTAIAGWLEGHATLMTPAERAATRADVEGGAWLDEGSRQRAMRALETTSAAQEALRAELARGDAAATLRRGPNATGALEWNGAESIGRLRALPDGRIAGCVVHARTLAATLATLPIPPAHRAVVTQGSGLRAAVEARASGALVATARLAPELGLRLSPADPRSVERAASRSRVAFGVLGAAGTLIAFGLAAVLFARMRAARRSSELRTDFVSAVSHELRTPIASVRMLAELLEEDRVEEGERREVHEALAREARRLGETVDRLLGFTRMAAGRYVLAREPIVVAEPVTASIDAFEDRHPQAAPIERDLDPAARGDLDAGQIRLAVDNLLANAAKYAPEGGPYRVAVARRDRDRVVEIRVADRGPGVAKRDQQRIFEPFERADDRLSRATEGSGIGLSLVRHVARAHGGDVRVDSTPGGGATFVMTLPAAPPAPERGTGTMNNESRTGSRRP